MAHTANYKNSMAHIARLKRAESIADKARAEFRKHNSWYDVTPHLDGTISIDIIWGDWKHDHLFADMVMKELGAKHHSTNVTEEDGSDCYSAIHIYIC